GTHVRFGSKADMCGAQAHVRFTPNSDRESGHPRAVMSALPPKADMCGALAHVGFGPKVDMYLFDHFVSGYEQRRWHTEAERFGRLGIDRKQNSCRLLDRQVSRFHPIKNFPHKIS